MFPEPASHSNPLLRIRVWYGVLLAVLSVFAVRAFYLQVIRHDFYAKAASSSQLKQYEIEAERGVIEAHDGENIVPIVLNEKRYTLYADPLYTNDPRYVEDATKAAKELAAITGGDAAKYEDQMRGEGRYAILAKKLTEDQQKAIRELGIKGVGTREESIRTYPQGTLAAQLLGFVNDEGKGTYGVEQYLNEELTGKPGQLKAITDASGVPLAANKDNIVEEPEPGKRAVLTIDISLQRQVEDLLKAGLERAKSDSGSALVLDVNSGAVKAMANYPTYNPAEFFKVAQEDIEVFQNPTVSAPFEVGSIMKPLTVAAAIDVGAVGKNTTYADPGQYEIDNSTVKNIEESSGAGTRSVADILQLSLNTGATWLLMQMGGGEVNEKARTIWHDYMAERFRFGKPVGIEQGYEAPGMVPDPHEGFGLNIRYANTAFGQGMTATTLQMAAAMSSVLNGGTYYQPHLISRLGEENREPAVIRKDVVKPETGRAVTELMEYVVQQNHAIYSIPMPGPEFSIGGKTGTAEIARPEGGYYEDRFNGTFIGFVGGDTPEYVIVVQVNEPKLGGYAGSQAAAPLFGTIAKTLIDNFGVTPKRQ